MTRRAPEGPPATAAAKRGREDRTGRVVQFPGSRQRGAEAAVDQVLEDLLEVLLEWRAGAVATGDAAHTSMHLGSRAAGRALDGRLDGWSLAHSEESVR